ncbi:MAG TPA: Cj0069 family protein [Burkholderiales bacterium]|nr:Cj0069 family protein [Burkholderiales bacterium]
MTADAPLRVALVYPGASLAERRNATPAGSRFPGLFTAIAALGAQAQPAVYHDEFAHEVREQLLGMDAVLVWVNPIQDGRDRRVLDDLLREVARAGVFVSTHPDVILQIGTKEVLYATRDMSWGSDTRLYASLDALAQALPHSLLSGARVLKQNRGHSGIGVWRVERDEDPSLLRVRHAQRGSVEQRMPLDRFVALCGQYFAGGGRLLDQAWQPRLPEGMVRCYLVGNRVRGFGIQAIVALHPAPPGEPPERAPQPGPRLYHPPTLAACQRLKAKVEDDWVPELQRRFHLDTGRLPALWDLDFLLGAKDAAGEDSYVLCEINVSSVAPFPDSAIEPLARRAVQAAAQARSARSSKTGRFEGQSHTPIPPTR